MTLRRKIAASTIAASLAVTAFAGLPLSNKGLAEKLGVSADAIVASAASYSDFLTEANKIYNALGTQGLADVNAFRAEIAAALAADATILDEVVNNLPAGKQAEFEAMLEDLISINIGTNWQTDLEAKRAQYKDLLKSLSAPGETLTVDDIAHVVLQLEVKLANLIQNATVADLTDQFKEKIRQVAKEAVESNAAVAAFANEHNVSSDDFASIYSKLQASSEVNAMTILAALKALDDAYNKVRDAETPDPPAGGGGGGFVPGEADKLVDELNKLKDKLDKATDEEKAKLISDAVEKAQALVEKMTKIDKLKGSVVDGKQVFELNEKDTLAILKDIEKIAKQLSETTGETLEPVSLSVDLGDVTESGVSVVISKEIVNSAAATLIANVVVTVNDLGVTIPLGGTFNNSLNLGVNWTDAEDGLVNGLPAVSAIYDFDLQVGGTTTTEFSKPVIIELPTNVPGTVDEDLLTVVKLLPDGTHEVHGGRVTGNSVVENRPNFSSYVVVENKVSFGDVARVEAWAGRSIEVMAAKGAIIGKSEGKFAPDDKVTRAEFAKMLVRALDLESNTAKEGFGDVTADDWFAPYVAAAVEKGIINGRSETRFAPEATITRAEMATMIARALGADSSVDVDAALADFSDADEILDTLKAGVAYAAANGIVEGKGAGKFAPNDNATRAQAAVIIHRALNK